MYADSIIREVAISTTRECHLIIARLAAIKEQEMTNNGEDTKKRELLNNVVEVHTSPNIMGNNDPNQ